VEIKLILTIIAVGFALAGTGQLPKVTHALKKMAVEAQKDDVVSLGDWNRALMGQSKAKNTDR
jgi:hypothetical protein